MEEITVFANEIGHARELCEPLQARQKPMTSSDAKYSIPFTVAVAVARRKVVIKDYSSEGIHDEQVLQIAQKVTPNYEAQKKIKKGREPGKVEIKIKGGKVYSRQVDIPYGHPDKPITWEDLIAKFKDCLSYSAKPISKDNTEQAIDMICNLEKVEDVGQIVRLLV